MSYIGSKPASKPVVASDLDPTVITGQTALAEAPASTDEFLISDAGVLKRLDASLIGGANTPYFSAKSNADQSYSDNTFTKVTLGTEIVDSDGKFASSRFTPTVSGNYFFNAMLTIKSSGGNSIGHIFLAIYKNGSLFQDNRIDFEDIGLYANKSIHAVVPLDTDDYVEFYLKNDEDGDTYVIESGRAIMSGFKLI